MDVDDISSNLNPTSKKLVLAGSATTLGLIGESSDLSIFRKDDFNRPLAIDNSALFFVGVKVASNPTQTINGGWIYHIPRTADAKGGSVQYHAPGGVIWSDTFTTGMESPIPTVSTKSTFVLPTVLTAGKPFYGILTPIDLDGRTRYGFDERSKITFGTMPQSVIPRLILRNDCYVALFSSQKAGSYIVETCVNGKPLDTSGAIKFNISEAVDALQCYAYGSGVCSGIVTENVSIETTLVDTTGMAYSGDANILVLLLIFLVDARALKPYANFMIG